MSPDGLGYRARIGLLTPNDDAVPESEFWTMAPEGVSVHVGRVLLVDTRTFADPPHPDDATALLAALPMQAIVFAFTTTGYILGPDGEQALKARLEKRSKRDSRAASVSRRSCRLSCLGGATHCADSSAVVRGRSARAGNCVLSEPGIRCFLRKPNVPSGFIRRASHRPATQIYRGVSRGAVCMGAHAGAKRGRSRFI